MTKCDEQYLGLLRDIVENGVEKDTRAGRVKSVFGRQLRFDLKEGIPLITTKKVFTKGIIHELLWFLQRPFNSHNSMNIEYLVRNNVHIWDDDAYRWFKQEIAEHINPRQYMVCVTDDEMGEKPSYEYWIENDLHKGDKEWLMNITKEEFLALTIQKVEIWGDFMGKYRFGDLGPIYGKQWRAFGDRQVDQINNIIETLKRDPNNRRMMCVAFNPNDIEDMALPPCHVMAQFYTRELSSSERIKIFNERYAKKQIPNEYEEWFKEYSKDTKDDVDVMMPSDGSDLDLARIPRYKLSCMFMMRSNDFCSGNPFNIVQYSLLTYMIANVVGMVPDELVYSVGDCHVYLNHMDGVKEQLSRKGSDIVPQLEILGEHKSIDDFKFEDFVIKDYYPEEAIRFKLNVG